MRMNPDPPDVRDDAMFSTTEAVKILGMSRTTFWRLVCAGKVKSKLHKLDGKPRYSGRELKRLHNSYY